MLSGPLFLSLVVWIVSSSCVTITNVWYHTLLQARALDSSSYCGASSLFKTTSYFHCSLHALVPASFLHIVVQPTLTDSALSYLVVHFARLHLHTRQQQVALV